jgi:hypothetical protein
MFVAGAVRAQAASVCVLPLSADAVSRPSAANSQSVNEAKVLVNLSCPSAPVMPMSARDGRRSH